MLKHTRKDEIALFTKVADKPQPKNRDDVPLSTLVPAFVLSELRAAFIIGFAFSAIMVPAQTLLQRETPPAMIGRVSSTNISVAFFGQILGLVMSGVMANLFGVRLVFFLCAALAVALAAGGRVFLRSR